MRKIKAIMFLIFSFQIVQAQKDRKGNEPELSYQEQGVIVHSCLFNDSSKVIYSRDSIGGIFYEIYLKSDLEQLDIMDSIMPRAASNLTDEKGVKLLVNNTIIELEKEIEDSKLLRPTTVSFIKYLNAKYFSISLNLISFTGGSYWWNVVLKIDDLGRVEKQYIKGNIPNGGFIRLPDSCGIFGLMITNSLTGEKYFKQIVREH